MGMGTSIYPIPGGDENETKTWYPLNLGMGLMLNFFLLGWVWGSETRHRPVIIPNYNNEKQYFYYKIVC